MVEGVKEVAFTRVHRKASRSPCGRYPKLLLGLVGWMFLSKPPRLLRSQVGPIMFSGRRRAPGAQRDGALPRLPSMVHYFCQRGVEAIRSDSVFAPEAQEEGAAYALSLSRQGLETK